MPMPPVNVLLHLAAATLALGLVSATLLLRKGGSRHRSLGRPAALALLATAVTSLWVPRFGAFSPLHIFTLVTLVNVPYGVWAIRTGRVRAHRWAMTGSAIGLFGAGLGALVPGRLLSHVLLG